MSDTARFHIVYDGLALITNEIDVRDLAPALLAVSDVIREANKTLNGERTSIAVKVKGSFKAGSFGIDLTVAQDFFSNLLNFAKKEDVVAAIGILNLMVFNATSLVKGVIQVLKSIIACSE